MCVLLPFFLFYSVQLNFILTTFPPFHIFYIVNNVILMAHWPSLTLVLRYEFMLHIEVIHCICCTFFPRSIFFWCSEIHETMKGLLSKLFMTTYIRTVVIYCKKC